MARFMGTVRGGRGEASRLGHASSGLETKAASWSGAVSVRMFDNSDGCDWVTIFAQEHGNRGATGTIFSGKVVHLDEMVDWWKRRDEIRAFLALKLDNETTMP